jgi:predicted MPP superfamily phosphohydrolase
MLNKIVPYFSFIFCACCLAILVNSEAVEKTWKDSRTTLKIWTLSDIQPKNQGQKQQFPKAIDDINKNIPDIDFAIVAGDIVDRASETDFDWYLSTKNLSYIKEWYEIAGNHDVKWDNGVLYKKKIDNNFNYSIIKGNILFILMSDELTSSETDISDETFNWWKDLIINNQDKIIVTVTHAPLEGSPILFSSFRRRQIKDSKRFTDVLKKYKVDIWLSGHVHVPQWFPNDIGRIEKYNETMFINVAGIRTEALGLKQSESRILTFICGSNIVLLQSRNHTEKRYNKDLEAAFKVSKEFECDL